jgi:hypothetical protein
VVGFRAKVFEVGVESSLKVAVGSEVGLHELASDGGACNGSGAERRSRPTTHFRVVVYRRSVNC